MTITVIPIALAARQFRHAQELRAAADAVEAAPDSDALNAAYTRAFDAVCALGHTCDASTEAEAEAR